LGENRKTYVLDIDGTICSQDGSNYESATPNDEVIRVANSLYEQGNEIIYFTARGSTTGIDWREITEGQLNKWGAKYHKLQLGKPFGDFYIDDKGMSISDFLTKGH
jgi:histidinol phosphatase-like enzyme